MNSFKTYHPIVNFTYFLFVIAFSMFFMHPVCLAVSLVCGFAYSIVLKGGRAFWKSFLYMLPMFIIAAMINPAFNHEGVTALAYLPSGNVLTLEAIACGAAASVMLASVICWFSCYNEIMTSDKFIYLFGKIIPSMSLILSMTLRFVPKFKAQLKVISDAQKGIGRGVLNGGAISRAKHGLTIISIMITWALENAVETADSMKSRGYGLKGRTAYSIFTFTSRDKTALLIIIALGIYVIAGKFTGGMYYRYFPSMKGAGVSGYGISVFAAYFAMCSIPVIIEVWEDRKWKRIKSKI